MSTNISKQKREDLLNKIKDIRTFISAARRMRTQAICFHIFPTLKKM